MGSSLDISFYPFRPDYKAPILAFIRGLQAHDDLEVKTNPLSTQVYGEFDRVWAVVGAELRRAFGEDYASVAVVKVVSVNVVE